MPNVVKTPIQRRITVTLALFMVTGIGVASEGVSVSVAPLRDLSVDIEFTAPAVVVSANHSIISAQVPGVISHVHADVGQTVSAGDLLIEIDDADASNTLRIARAQVASIEAQLELAESRLKKAQDLLKQDFVADEELLARETDVAVLKAQRDTAVTNVDSAALNLSRTRIIAPFRGTVVDRTAQIGALAAPGSPLLIITELDGREVDAQLSPDFAAGIEIGAPAVFRSRENTWDIELLRLSPVIDASARIQRARFQFAAEIAPVGAAGEIYWLSTEQLIPADFVQQRGSDLGVFIAEGERARFIPLPRAQSGRPSPIELPPETLIVVDGRARLQDGNALIIADR